MRQLAFVLAFFLATTYVTAQKAQYQIGCIGFYNLENLFDTIDTKGVRDSEFTPTGFKNYTGDIYWDKLNHLGRVISEMGTEVTPDGVAVLGVSEIENRSVLEDLVKNPFIADRNYEIVHYDSPDKRGIDVGLLYQPKYFTVLSSRAVPVLVYTPDSIRKFTRDVLLVNGLFNGDTLHIMVNHWSSRGGGVKATQGWRNEGARVCKHLSDSLRTINPDAKIIILGDLNDDPTSASVKKVLNAKFKKKKVKKNGFFNTMYHFYKKGFGTLAYRDSWNLFDQIIVSGTLLDKNQSGYFYLKSKIHKKKYMISKKGKYKGYPKRTFSGNAYIGGYSDHLPTMIFLAKKIVKD